VGWASHGLAQRNDAVVSQNAMEQQHALDAAQKQNKIDTDSCTWDRCCMGQNKRNTGIQPTELASSRYVAKPGEGWSAVPLT